MFFFFGASGNFYNVYVFTYAVCIRKFSNSLASILTSSYFAGLWIGRITGVVLALYMSPKWILLSFGFGEAICAIVLKVFSTPETQPDDHIFFAFTCIIGFFASPLYGAAVVLAQEYLDMTKLYAQTFALGNYAGQLAFLPLAGNWVLENPDIWLGVSMINNLMVSVASITLVYVGHWLYRRNLRTENDVKSRNKLLPVTKS